MKTYFVCYDTEGAGFDFIERHNSFAFGEDELKAIIADAIDKFEIEEHQICIFELTNKYARVKDGKIKIKKGTHPVLENLTSEV